MADNMTALMVDEYLFDLRVRNLSPRTVATAEERLSVFASFVGEEEITERTVKRFVAQMLSSGLSPYTVKTRTGTIRAFLNWCHEQKDEDTGNPYLPSLKVPSITTPRIIRDILTRDEIKLLEDSATCVRDKLIIRILADTGMRVSELTGLTVEDSAISVGNRHYIRVNGKGNKERDIPVHPQLVRRIRRYSAARKGLLFHSRKQGAPLTVHAVQQMLRGLGKIVGRTPNPHLFRHSFITWMLLKGMDSVLLSRIVGHADLNMIQEIYSHLKAMDAHDPMLKAMAS